MSLFLYCGRWACRQLRWESGLKLRLSVLASIIFVSLQVSAQTVYTDSFSTNVNYLTNGLVGTIWDGVYFGAGDFNNTGVGGGGLGQTLICNANITTAKTLTVDSTGTAWEGPDDDGFFLYKVAPGDFSTTVHVVSPFNNAGYNTAGLQARAFSADGDPYNGSENFVSWTRFDEYGFANYLRSEVNGTVAQINPGDYPNTNYWLRMDRVKGTNFYFYEKSTKLAAWQSVSFPSPVNGAILTRPDLAGLPLQVGIIHATFSGELQAQFTDFSLSESNTATVTAPAAPTKLVLTTNNNQTLNVTWAAGTGSSGSVVVAWSGTNSAVQAAPANGFTYTGNAAFGLGSALPMAGAYVVYAGSATNVMISNLAVNTTYNIAVFSYAGSGSSTTYNRTAAVKTVTIPPNQVSAWLDVQSGNVTVMFSANPGEWYWLQYSDSLKPANWQNVQPGPSLATSSLMSLVDATGGSLGTQRFYRLQQIDPQFTAKNNSGGISSLKFTDDTEATEYISGGELGSASLQYEPVGGSSWSLANTATATGIALASYSTNVSATGSQYVSHYTITNGLPGALIFESVFALQQNQVHWILNLTNSGTQAITIGNLALPLPMNTTYSGTSSSTMKHSFISGSGSFIFWMRPDSVGPYLLLTPDENTKLEYWDDPSPPGGYEVYIHAAEAESIAATEYPSVITQGSRWRQPTTSLTLAPGQSQTYGFKLQWVNDYNAIRQALVDNGGIDVHIVPGMTVPTNLFAEFALRTTQTVASVTAEFPAQTQIQGLGTTNVAGQGAYQLYQVQFSRLGENELTINYGSGQAMYLEFMVTEPLETLVKKRAAYLVGHQILTNQWYSGLFCDYNMNDGQLITPDNHDTLDDSFQVYEIASDDAGESRPAYLAAKESVFPVQSEVTALDYYITNFVWGGLQRATNESYSYGIYGVPDWHTLRTNNNLSIGRGYDYPHIIAMYYYMYQVAKNSPEVTTVLPADTYLQRAWGTAMAMWSYGGSQATEVGLMNELVIPNVINALQTEGMTSRAASLKALWEAKVDYYISGQADLFASEYAFDATGFESQEAYAKYAFQHSGTDPAMGSTNLPLFLSEVQQFTGKQITANVFDRGWLETAYYYYGSDYRGDMGDDFVVTYMAQMGGWGLLDYALNYATNAADYLRLGYASYLCGWSTMNSGNADSNYGFWYPGILNDGGCGGGFEPSPYNVTWLGGQPMHRGPWYYSAEENLGFCGAIRSAATILADDPIFGRFCYGGIWTNASDGLEIVPQDGVRQRFDAMLSSGNLYLTVDTDHFATGQPIVLQPNLSAANFQIETANSSIHTIQLHVTTTMGGTYAVNNSSGSLTNVTITSGVEAIVNLPMPAGSSPISFSITKQ